MRCPRCAHENRPGARFCDECATALIATSAGAERRHLAVVFADLVGSTQLSQRIDPEDLRDVLGAYHEVVRSAVHRCGGHVAMLLGDGVISYFGFPHAHEHDVERAVRAGLAIVEAVRTLGAGTDVRHRDGLAVRVGVHAGEVVVGQADGLGADIFGDTPNVAARLQALAGPHSVVISGATQRLVQGLFRVEDLGVHHLRGVDHPTAVYRVLSPSGVRSRLLAGEAALTPFVGRDAEVARLRAKWEEARTAGGRAVVVSGEAGIGKSRLVHTFRASIAETPHTWLECGGSPYTQDSPFHPVIELQAGGLGFVPDDGPEERLAKLEAALERANLSLADTVPLFARLHSIPLPARYAHALPLPGRYASIGLTPEAIRRKTKEAARDWLLRMSRQQPIVLLIEDLHWIDPSSLELVGEIMAGLADTQALLVLTHRPSFVLPWPLPAHGSALALARLGPDEAVRLVTSAAAGRELPRAWIGDIVAKTDGVPLFLEEMTKAALDAGGATPRLDVPATLKGLLMARLDQLGEAREAAQLGAVIGREFSYDLLRAVWQRDESALRDAIVRLTDAELLYRRSESLQEGYVFKHALVQEAAYESLLKTDRRALHERIGTALEERFATLVALQPELLAHHFTEAQRPERAVAFWYQAAQGGIERSAHLEVIRHLMRGVACTEQLPPGPARDALELGLRIQLAANLRAVKGYAAPEMLEACVRARELCSALGESPEIFPVLFALWIFHLVRSDRATTRDLAAQMMTFAEQVGEAEFLCRAHVAGAITSYWQGDFRAAREHAIVARGLFTPELRKLATYGDDPETYGYIYDGMPSWFLECAEESKARMFEGLAVAEGVGYAFSIAGVLSFTTQLHQLAGDVDRTSDLAERTITFSTEQSFPLWLGAALVHRGWVFLQRGDLPAAIAEIEHGVGVFRATGAMLNVHYFLGLLAEAHLATGDRARGLATVDEALGLTDKHLDTYFAPELWRLKGDLLGLTPADTGGAEVCYRRALALAQQQEAAFHELRATVSVAKLLAARGEIAAARQLLTATAGRPSPGAPRDREEADHLLSSLGSGVRPGA